ncbi:Vacuolar protein sorting-associated protein 16 [Malassezia sp. CBS 17886]|nr:Vacuolar protein sorting-associated protein 16 [Malassezia sp. CBS 17886]
MASARASTAWHKLGAAYYRRTLQYDLAWPISSLAGYLVAPSTDGSLLALVRDPSQLVALGDAADAEPRILVYSGAGQLVETLPWDASSRIVGLGFSWRDELVVVTDDAQIRMYALLERLPAVGDTGAPARREATQSSHYLMHSFGDEAAEVGLASVLVQPTRVLALARDASVWVWHPWGDALDVVTAPPWAAPPAAAPAARLGAVPADGEGAARITAWAPVSHSASVLLATPGMLWSVDEHGARDVHMPGAFAAVRTSPNGHLVALLSHEQQLLVYSTNFTRRLRAWDVGASDAVRTCRPVPRILPPLDDARDAFAPLAPTSKGGLADTGIVGVEWCGDDTVALAWANEVLLLGPYGDPISFPVPDVPRLRSDDTGLMLLHAEAHEYVEKARGATEAALRPGSTDVATVLLDASQQAQRSDPRAYEAVRAVLADLARAVDTCVDAAAYEWDAAAQHTLLQAALFGKTFLDTYDSARLLRVAQRLRVLNAARAYDVGIPAQYASLEAGALPLLLYRLAARGQHRTAVRIAQFLGVRADAVLKHWARAKVARARPRMPPPAADEALARTIIARFEEAGSFRYADIAATAWQAGRPRLAKLLLDHEVRAVDQVPLLLKMREHHLALQKAAECGDADLVYHVLFRLQRILSRGEFFRVVQGVGARSDGAAGSVTPAPPAASPSLYTSLPAALLEQYAKEQDVELLRDFYFQDDRRCESALLCVHEAMSCAVPTHMAERIAALRDAQKHFAEDRARSSEARLTDEACTLLEHQTALEKEATASRTPADSVVGKSLAETIQYCLQHNWPKRADRLKHEYRVSDARFYAMKVCALVRAQHWEELWRFVTGRRPPDGFAPIISQLLHAGAVEEACSRARIVALIDRCPDEGVRMQLRGALGG